MPKAGHRANQLSLYVRCVVTSLRLQAPRSLQLTALDFRLPPVVQQLHSSDISVGSIAY